MPDGYTGSVEAYSPDLVDALRQLRVPDSALEPVVQNGFAVVDGDEAADDGPPADDEDGKAQPKPKFDLGKFRCHATRECLYQRVVKTDAKGKSRIHYSQVRHPAGMPRLLRVLRPKGLPFASRRSVEETRYLIEWVGLPYPPQWVREGELDNGDAWAYFPGVEISSRTERTNYANVVKAQIRAFKIRVERPPRHTGFVDDPEVGWRYYLPDGRWLGPNGTSGGTQQSDADGDIGIPDCDFPLGEIWREEFRVLPSAPPSSEDIAELGRFLVDVNQRGQISAQVGGAVRSLPASMARFASMIYVVGATGEGKTVGATFPLGVIGPRPPDFQTDTTFQATPTSIEGVIRPNRDRPILVDDLNNPTVNSLGERVRNYQTVERVARASYEGGEVFGRGSRDASRRQGTIIRGLITVTGETAEDLKESTCRRVILLQFARGETDWVLLREGWRAYQPILTSLGHAVIRFVLDLLAKEGPRAVRDLINRLDREAYDYMLEGLQSARPEGNGVFIHSLAKCYSFLLSGAVLGDLACGSENALIEAVRPHLVALAIENLDTVTGAGVGTPPAEFFHGAIYRALHTNAHLFSRRTDKPLSGDIPAVGDYGYRPVIRDGCVSYEPIGTTQLGWLEDDNKTLCLRTRELTAVCNEEARRQGLRVQFSEQTLPGLLVALGVVVPGPDQSAQARHVPAGGPRTRVLVVVSREDASEAVPAVPAVPAPQNTSVSATNAGTAYKNEVVAENRAVPVETEKNTRVSAAFDEPSAAGTAAGTAGTAGTASDQMPYARPARARQPPTAPTAQFAPFVPPTAPTAWAKRPRAELGSELLGWGRFRGYPLLRLQAGARGGRDTVLPGEDEWRLFARIAAPDELAAALRAAQLTTSITEGFSNAAALEAAEGADVAGEPASPVQAETPLPAALEGAGCAEAGGTGLGSPNEIGPSTGSAEALAPDEAASRARSTSVASTDTARARSARPDTDRTAQRLAVIDVGVVHVVDDVSKPARTIAGGPAGWPDLLPFARLSGISLLWVTPRWCEAAVLPGKLTGPPNDRNWRPHKGMAHPLAGELAGGWQSQRTRGFFYPYETYVANDGQEIEIAIPGFGLGVPALESAPAPLMADTLRLLRLTTRFWFRINLNAMTNVMLRPMHSGPGTLDLRASQSAADCPAPMLKPNLVIDAPHLCPPQADEIAVALWIYGYDTNRQYGTAMASLDLGFGVPVHQTGNIRFDRERAGYWYARVSRPPGLADGLPHPCKMERGHKPETGFRWYVTPTLDLAEKLHAQIDVTQAWLFPDTHQPLQSLYNRLNAAAAALMAAAGDPAPRIKDAPTVTEYVPGAAKLALDVVKQIPRSGIGNFDARTRRGATTPYDLYRPDWRHFVIAKARANLLRAVYGAGLVPIAIETDSIYIVSPHADPAIAAGGLKLSPQGGHFKVKWSAPIASLPRGFRGKRTPSMADLRALKAAGKDTD